ncbi:hypothetical protein GGH92_003297 [Coemansia sp. RSA 2673]|nr:hypothetical protein GGH92_003297 [Coemansia sp. RSA 2673]
MYLFLDPSTAGVDSFCVLRRIPNHQQYVFIICVVAIWEYLAGIIGVLSITALLIHIIQEQKRTERLLRETAQHYGPSNAVSRNTDPELLNRTLRTVIWFPITPIIALWLNVILFSVYYYKQQVYMALEFINVILLGLQSFFLAIALVVNPSVRCAHTEHSKRRQREKAEQEVAREQSNSGEAGPALPQFLALDTLSIDELSISPTFP